MNGHYIGKYEKGRHRLVLAGGKLGAVYLHVYLCEH